MGLIGNKSFAVFSKKTYMGYQAATGRSKYRD